MAKYADIPACDVTKFFQVVKCETGSVVAPGELLTNSVHSGDRILQFTPAVSTLQWVIAQGLATHRLEFDS